MYPKDFFSSFRLEPEPGTCFLVMPFAKAFDRVFSCIKIALEGDLGIACVRTDELLGGGDIIQDILRSLATSELIIVDVTGRKPNVFYELGIAHMCKPVEKVILLSQEIDAIPFDLRGFRHIVYDPTAAGLTKMSKELRDAVDAVRERLHRIVLDDRQRGVLRDPLMGTDRCLYGFEVNGAAAGHNAAKVSLTVVRHVMGVGHNRRTGKPATLRSERVFNGGMGLLLGRPTKIQGTEFSILLERVLDRKPHFRILQTDLIAPASTTGHASASSNTIAAPALKRTRRKRT